MLVYTAERQHYWPYVLKQMLIGALILFGFRTVYNLLFPADAIGQSYYWYAAGFLLMRFVQLLSRPRVQQIEIDAENQTLYLHYRTRISGEGEKKWLINHVQLAVKQSGTSITFWKGLWQNLNINTREDGFSADVLREMTQKLQVLGAQVKG